MSMVSVSSLTYEYPEIRALDNVSFTLEEGSITALVGPNGAGKSTLMRCMAALDTPLSGSVRIGTLDTAEHPRDIHRMMGYLPDTFGVYDGLSVEQTLRYFAEANGVKPAERSAAVERVIGLCDLQAYRTAKAESLSRGWRQRLGIAQTLIHQPPIILLDEPASGLDPEARHSLSQLFLRLKEEGCCLLVSSHILAELEDYSDRMLILRSGTLMDDGEAEASQTTLTIRVELTEAAEKHQAKLNDIAGITLLKTDGKLLHIALDTKTLDSAGALAALSKKGLPIAAFTPEHQTMQQRYMARANAPMGNG